MRVFNFAAGPATLPLEVLEQSQAEMTDWRGSGMSVMEVSHRSKAFIAVAHEAGAALRALLAIPPDHRVLFLYGGATGQFSAIPLNLATQDSTVQSLFLSPLQAFYTAQATRAAVVSTTEAERAAREGFNAAESRYNVGVATPADRLLVAESVYNKIDSVAQLGIGGGNSTVGTYDPNGGYSDNDQTGGVSNGGSPTIGTPKPGNYTVPNAVILTGVLDNEVKTKVSQNNDRFRMIVQSPNEFRGAVIEGSIAGINRSGKVTGQSKTTFNFERITLRNGETYDFAAVLQSIKDPNGKTVKVDNEGTAKGDSQTKETAKRGGIGAGIGAIIGAIAGGAKGAAIGAVIGAGGGAGSVILTGKEDIRLMAGSTMTIQSTSPQQSYPR